VAEETGTSTQDADGPSDLGRNSIGSRPKGPGWYATGTNPNEQNYWDGKHWAYTRHWIAGSGWVEGEGVAQTAAVVTSPARQTRFSANPYAEHVEPASRGTSQSRRAPSGATLSLGVLLLMASGIALMAGSVGTWVNAHGSHGVPSFPVSLNGIDPGVATLIGINGWVTFIAGIVVTIMGGLSLMSNEILLATLTTFAAAVTLAFAGYDMFRIVQKLSNVQPSLGANVSVGWGLICILSAAVLAMLVAIGRLLQR
jgi:cation transport ATPase